MSVAKKLYSKLPVFAQNMLFTGAGLQQSLLRYGPQFRQQLSELKDSEWADESEIRAFQNQQLEHLVAHCYETVPYYRDLFDEHSLKPTDIRNVEDLPRIPILTKATIREQGERLLSSAVSRKSMIVSMTSGTTGTPIKIYRTKAATMYQWAIYWRHRARFGIRPGDSFLTFGAKQILPADHAKAPYWRINHASNQSYLAIDNINDRSLPAIFEYINRKGFDFFAGFSSAMALLAYYIRENGLKLHQRPKRIFPGSEVLLPQVKDLLESEFGAPVSDVYGMRENVACISTNEDGLYLEDYEFGITELLDIEDFADGPKRIVATGFANAGWPLLRYEVGDLAVPSDRRCAYGRQMRTFERIEGRKQDYIRTPEGRNVSHLIGIFKYAPGAREGQIVQERLDEITVKIVKSTHYTQRDTDGLLGELRSRLGNSSIGIKLEFVDAIERSKTGKLRPVISRIGSVDRMAEQHAAEAADPEQQDPHVEEALTESSGRSLGGDP